MASKPKPPKRFRALARMDMSASTSHIDELEYALEGLSSENAAVRLRCSLDVVSLFSDQAARSAALRTHGVLGRVVTAIAAAADASEPQYALALAGLLGVLSMDGLVLDDDHIVSVLVPRVMRHIAACGAAVTGDNDADDDATLPSKLAPLWRSLQNLCPALAAARVAPLSPATAFFAARRLCVLSLASCARGSPAACATARDHVALHELPRIIAEHTQQEQSTAPASAARKSGARKSAAPAAAPPVGASDELTACVELLHLTTFPSDTAPSGATSKASAAAAAHCAPGGKCLDLLPVIRIAERLASDVYGGGDEAPALSRTASKSRSPGSRGAAARSALSFEETRAAARHGLPASAAAPAKSCAFSSEIASPSAASRSVSRERSPSVACTSPAQSSASLSASACSGSAYSLSSASKPPRTFSVADRKRRRAAAAEAAAAVAAQREGGGSARRAMDNSANDPFAFVGDDVESVKSPGGAKQSPAAAKPSPQAPADPFAFEPESPPPVAPRSRSRSKGKQPAGQGAGNGVAEHSMASPAPSAGSVAAPSTAASVCAGSESGECGDGIEIGEEATPSRSLLEHSLRSLVNLTHRSRSGCATMACDGLPLAVGVIGAELLGSEARTGQAVHYDSAMMAIGILINYLEMCAQGAGALGSLACNLLTADAGAPSSPAAQPPPPITLVLCLSRSLKALLVPLPPTVVGQAAGPESNDPSAAGPSAEAAGSEGEPAVTAEEARAIEQAAEAVDRRVMEREVSAAYITLLLGFICRVDKAHAETVLHELEQPNFAHLGKLLRSFLELQAGAHLIGAESAKIMAAIVQWMERGVA